MFNHTVGDVTFLLDHNTVWLAGDGFAFSSAPDASVDQTVADDARRRWDLTWEIDEGGRHRAVHRLDRAAIQWQPGSWSITAGRQAVSWGSGIVFQPMDLFSPFSPTVVDRDYKAGDDLLLVERLFQNGHDVSMLHVMRRDAFGDSSSDVTSTAVKWHGYLPGGGVEFEALAARHYDEPVYAASVQVPIGQALLRADLVASRAREGDWRYSGVVNADITLLVRERNVYLFAEYFRNGWGVADLPSSVLALPRDLGERLERGEVFNLMRDYLSVGGTIEWHPLISQSATLITNLRDSSSLFQLSLSYLPGDEQSLQLGWLEPLGRAGDEFGGVPVFGNLTSGGGSRLFLRWVYYL